MKRFSRSFAFLLMLVLMLACATVFAFASDADAGLPEAGEGAEYDGSYTNSKGETTYFKGQLGFEAAMDDAIATATYNTRNTVCEIKLFNDVEYYKAFTFPRYINLKIDLNGHTLTRIDLYGTKMTYDPATETYVESTTTAARNAFIVPRDVIFTMTSSTPGAVFKTASVQGTAYYDENGKVESYTGTSVRRAGMFVGSAAPMYSHLKLENIEIYAEMILNTSYNGIKDFSLDVIGCKFYKTYDSDAAKYNATYDYNRGLIFIGTNGAGCKVNLEDSLFYIAGSSIKASNEYYQFIVLGSTGATGVNIDNCDIITDNNTFGIRTENAAQTITITNSRIYQISHCETNVSPTIVGANNYVTDDVFDAGVIADGCTELNGEVAKTYSLPTNVKITVDSETKHAAFDFAFENRTIVFEKKIGVEADLTEVSWLDESGKLLAKTQDFKGTETIPPRDVQISLGNGYLAYSNPDWIGSDNNTDLIVPQEDASFTAKLPANPEYTVKLDEVLFNMGYLGHFAYRVYVPKVEGVEVTKLGSYGVGSSNFGVVKIEGKEYYYGVSHWMSPTNALFNKSTTVEFTCNGVQYTGTIKGLSALTYAEALCSEGSAATALEKDAITKMIAYCEEVYASIGGTDASALARLEAFYTDYNGGARPENIALAEEEIYTVDETFSTYVDSLQFAIYTNNRMSFIVTLNKDAVAAGYKLKAAGIAGGFSTPKSGSDIKYNEDGSISYYTDNTSLTGGIMHPCYVVSVLDAQGNVLASTNYSLATYANAVKTDLAYSLYTFGKAAAEVKAYLLTL